MNDITKASAKRKKKKSKRSKSDSDDSEEWTEAAPTQAADSQSKLQRDEWMSMASSFTTTTSRKETRKQNRKETLVVLDKPGQSERELNPYWKNGGSGLPMEEKEGPTPLAVGDGGAGWLRKAYRRLKEQAADEGRTMEELATERYGSLERLEKMLEEAEGSSRHRKDHHGRSRNERFRRPGEDDSNRHNLHRRHHSRHSEENRSSRPRWMKRDEAEETSKDAKPPPVDSRRPSHTEKSEISAPAVKVPVEEERISVAQPEVLSEKEMNELGAKLVKAELMGNTDLAKRLKQHLDAARSAAETHREEPRVVLLTQQSGSMGMSRPLEAPSGSNQAHNKKKQKVLTHDASGQRVRYFGDDDRYSLKQMFEKEKFSTADDDTAMFLKMAAKGRTDGDYDFDDLFVDKSAVQESEGHHREIQRAIREDKHMSAAQENCPRCLDSKMMQKHLIVAMGTKSYLAVPGWKSLVEGHCLIVPMVHVAASTLLDEDVWTEMQTFRKSLHRMFLSRGFDTIFLETSMHLRRQPHTFLECLPMPMDDGALAPMYFKKAILESETEWAQNKKLVDLSKKDIRHSVPKGLPYFSVDFGLTGGFAHVIEDEKLFPRYFGAEIIGGILDLEPQLWMKQRREAFEGQSKKVLEFTQWWKPYDWVHKNEAL